MAETDGNYSAPTKSGFRSSRYPGFIGGKIDPTSGNLQFGTGSPAPATISPTTNSTPTNGLSSARIRRPLPQGSDGVDGRDKPGSVYHTAPREAGNNWGSYAPSAPVKWGLRAASFFTPATALVKGAVNVNNVQANVTAREKLGRPQLSLWDRALGVLGFNEYSDGLNMHNSTGYKTGDVTKESLPSVAGASNAAFDKLAADMSKPGWTDHVDTGSGGGGSDLADNTGWSSFEGNSPDPGPLGGQNAGYNPGDVTSVSLPGNTVASSFDKGPAETGGGGSDGGGSISGNFSSSDTGGVGADTLGTGSGGGSGSSSSSSSRVICSELVRQGLMSREQRHYDLRFTFEHLTPTHICGYHYWARPYVRLMKRSKLATAFMRFVGCHRANEIMHIYGQAQPDYIGKIMRLVWEPFCFVIGLFVRDINWKKLYNTGER